MRSRRGSRGRFASLYGTMTLRLGVDFQYPLDGPRYELLVVDGSGQLIVPLNEWYLLMRGVGAERTRNTYLAVLPPWFGFLSEHQPVERCTGGRARVHAAVFVGRRMRSQAGRIEGWFVQ